MSADTTDRVASILKNYSSSNPGAAAKALRKVWLQFAPNRGMELINAEQREQFEVIGIPVPVLRGIGSETAAAARKDVRGFFPLAQLLWNEYGREPSGTPGRHSLRTLAAGDSHLSQGRRS